MEFLKRDFPIIIDDRSVGLIRLFPMIDYEILADSQHLVYASRVIDAAREKRARPSQRVVGGTAADGS